MQALAGVRVLAVGVHDEDVLRLESLERDARVGEDLVGVELFPVERDLTDFPRDQIDEGEALGRGGEADDAPRAEDLGALGQIEGDFVGLRVDDVAALLRFDTGEVLSRHSCTPRGEGMSPGWAQLAPTATLTAYASAGNA